jgi:hypothetical protein
MAPSKADHFKRFRGPESETTILIVVALRALAFAAWINHEHCAPTLARALRDNYVMCSRALYVIPRYLYYIKLSTVGAHGAAIQALLHGGPALQALIGGDAAQPSPVHLVGMVRFNAARLMGAAESYFNTGNLGDIEDRRIMWAFRGTTIFPTMQKNFAKHMIFKAHEFSDLLSYHCLGPLLTVVRDHPNDHTVMAVHPKQTGRAAQADNEDGHPVAYHQKHGRTPDVIDSMDPGPMYASALGGWSRDNGVDEEHIGDGLAIAKGDDWLFDPAELEAIADPDFDSGEEDEEDSDDDDSDDGEDAEEFDAAAELEGLAEDEALFQQHGLAYLEEYLAAVGAGAADAAGAAGAGAAGAGAP